LRAHRILPFQDAYIQQAKTIEIHVDAHDVWAIDAVKKLLMHCRQEDQGKSVLWFWHHHTWLLPMRDMQEMRLELTSQILDHLIALGVKISLSH
jgi:hypothetical protein